MIKLDSLIVGNYGTNCYIYRLDNSPDTIIIDPGDEADKICNFIESNNLTPKAIFLTHGHGDHIGAVNDIIAKYDIPLYAGKGEEELLTNSTSNLSAMVGTPVVTPEAKKLFEDEEMITIAGIDFRVLSTPGHSPGGVCYLDEKHNILFTGDTLFNGSIGRTDFPGCSTEKLMSSINDKILKLPDGIKCYPGHGPETTVGAERVNNPFLNGSYFV